MKRSPISYKRSTSRRGTLTPSEKKAVRLMAYLRAEGRCELDHHLGCCGGKALPWDGDLRRRGHLVHLRNRRMHGWGSENVAWGCAHGHMDLMHLRGVQVPKTYSDLTEWARRNLNMSQERTV